MKLFCHKLLAIAAAAFAILCAVPAQAGTFAIDPTRLTFSTMSSGDVTVTNVGQTATRLSVHAYEWNQNGGKPEQLVPTSDVAYYPQLFVLPPGASQRIRVGVTAAPAAIERTYRLTVSELPQATQPGALHTAGVTFLSRVDIPVLLSPAGPATAVPYMGELEMHENAVTVRLENRGTTHIEQSPVSAIVLDGANRVIWRTTANAFYVLPHSRLDVRCAVPGRYLRSARSLTAVWDVKGAAPLARTYPLH